MTYYHGIRKEEVATQVEEPKEVLTGIPVVIGTAPINLVSEPKANQLIYAKNYEEAVKAVGYSEEFDKYTLCQSIFAQFRKFKVGPIILINVLDPEKHKTAIEEQECAVKEKQTTLEIKGLLLSSLVVKNGEAELSVDTDYIATFDDEGNTLITLLDTTNTVGISTVKVSGDKIDPSKVTVSDVIGGYDEETGVETGLELIRQVFPKFNVFPGSIIAPYYSKNKNVAAMMESKCEEINGMFDCQAIIDIDTEEAMKYTDVEKAKSNMGITGRNTILTWPMLKYGDAVISYSAALAALIQYTDMQNKGVPSASPSNQPLGCDAICIADGTEILLDEAQANTLNAVGVVTAINFGGFRSWGNNTACYPLNKDPKDRWISCRRFFSWWENNFITTYHEKVDGNPTYKKIQGIVDNENIKGNSYVAAGHCAGASIEFRMVDNPIENIINGHFVFIMHLAPWTPMEDIKNKFEFDVSTLEQAFSEFGGEE